MQKAEKGGLVMKTRTFGGMVHGFLTKKTAELQAGQSGEDLQNALEEIALLNALYGDLAIAPSDALWLVTPYDPDAGPIVQQDAPGTHEEEE